MKRLLVLFAPLLLSTTVVAQFSTSAQTEILQVHNDMRSAIAFGSFEVQGNAVPSAANMIKLKWGKNLATKAQEYASACDDYSNVDPQFGINTLRYYSQTTPTSLNPYGKKAALSWADEFEDWGLESNYFGEDTDTGITDATQMIWALTSSVGCGVANCGKDEGTFTKAYRIEVVCLYIKKGNVVGEEIYEGGDTCSTCSGYYACDETTGLCA